MIHWAEAILTFLVALIAALFQRQVVVSQLRKLSRPDSPLRILYETLYVPTILWCVMLALGLTIAFSSLPPRGARIATAANVVCLVLSLSLAISHLLVRLGTHYAQKRGLAHGLSGVSRALVHVFILLLATSFLLRYFEVAVAPFLTALGVGGLAVALALRDTLANFFAGVHILVEAPISVGEFVRLSSGEEGTVTDIGWRTTRVLATNNNVIVIPNEKITSSILTNYALPDNRVTVVVDVVAGLDADVEQVARILSEEAAKAEGVLPDMVPTVLFDPGVLPSHIQMKVIFLVAHRLEQGKAASNVRLRVHQRFVKEGVPLPSAPQVAVMKA